MLKETPTSPDENTIYFSWKQGVLTIWRTRSVYQVKFPWNKPLFSERYRYKVPKFKLLGFRYFIHERRPPPKPKLRVVK